MLGLPFWNERRVLFISFAKPGPSLLLPLRQTSRLARARRNLSVAGEILHGPTLVALACASQRTRAAISNARRPASAAVLQKLTWTASRASSNSKGTPTVATKRRDALEKGSPSTLSQHVGSGERQHAGGHGPHDQSAAERTPRGPTQKRSPSRCGRLAVRAAVSNCAPRSGRG